MSYLDKTIDEIKEDLEALYGKETENWTEEEIREVYDDLCEASINLIESDFSQLDAVDEEFNARFDEWVN